MERDRLTGPALGEGRQTYNSHGYRRGVQADDAQAVEEDAPSTVPGELAEFLAEAEADIPPDAAQGKPPAYETSAPSPEADSKTHREPPVLTPAAAQRVAASATGFNVSPPFPPSSLRPTRHDNHEEKALPAKLSQFEESKTVQRIIFSAAKAKACVDGLHITNVGGCLTMGSQTVHAINATVEEQGGTGVQVDKLSNTRFSEYSATTNASTEYAINFGGKLIRGAPVQDGPEFDRTPSRVIYDEDAGEFMDSFHRAYAVVQQRDYQLQQTVERQRAACCFRTTIRLVVNTLLYIAQHHKALKNHDKVLIWVDEVKQVLGSSPRHFTWMRLDADTLFYKFDMRHQKLIHDFFGLMMGTSSASILGMSVQMAEFHLVEGESLDHGLRRLRSLILMWQQNTQQSPIAARYEDHLVTFMPHIIVEGFVAGYTGKGQSIVQQLCDRLRAWVKDDPEIHYSILLDEVMQVAAANSTVVVGDDKAFDSVGRAELANEEKRSSGAGTRKTKRALQATKGDKQLTEEQVNAKVKERAEHANKMTTEEAWAALHGNGGKLIKSVAPYITLTGTAEDPTYTVVKGANGRLTKKVYYQLSALQQAAVGVLERHTKNKKTGRANLASASETAPTAAKPAAAELGDVMDRLDDLNEKVARLERSDGERPEHGRGLSAVRPTFQQAIMGMDAPYADDDRPTRSGRCCMARKPPINKGAEHSNHTIIQALYDTGCNTNGGTTSQVEVLHNATPSDTTITTCEGVTLSPPCMGTMRFTLRTDQGDTKALEIHGMQLVPNSGVTLFSCAAFMRLGASVTIDAQNGMCIIFDDGATVTVNDKDGLYPIEIRAELVHAHALAAVSTASLQTWHRRLAHVPDKMIVRMFDHGLVDGLQIASLKKDPKRKRLPRTDRCGTCEATGRRSSHSREARDKADTPGTVWHVDLKQFSTIGRDGSRYMVVYIDVYTRYIFIRCTADKTADTVTGTLVELVEFLKLYDLAPVEIISDRGAEFGHMEESDSLFTRAARHNGIKHRRIPVDTPQANGMVERANGTIVRAASRLLLHSQVHRSLWPWACRNAARVHNTTIHPVTGNSVPFTLLTGEPADISNMRVWGCDCFVQATGAAYHKSNTTNTLFGIWVGLGDDNIGHEVFLPATGEVVTTLDVRTNEDLSDRRAQLGIFDANVERSAGTGADADFIVASKDDPDAVEYVTNVRRAFSDGKDMVEPPQLLYEPRNELGVNGAPIGGRSEYDGADGAQAEQPDVAGQGDEQPDVAGQGDEHAGADKDPEHAGADQDPEHAGADQATDQEARRAEWTNHKQPNIVQDTPPLRQEPKGKAIPKTPEHEAFLRWLHQNLDTPIYIDKENPKQASSASHARYEATKMAETAKEYYVLQKHFGTPRSKARLDFINDYLRGYISFPGREPKDPRHYLNAITLAAMCIHHEAAAIAAATAREQLAAAAQAGQPEPKHDGHDATHDERAATAAEEPTPATPLDDPDRFGATITATFMHEVIEQVERQIRCSNAFAAKEINKLMLTDPIDLSQHIEPTNYKDAINGPDSERWRASMQKEIDNVNKMKTWELIPANECPVRPIGCKWVFRIKLDSNGAIAKFKARIVAKGFSEVLGEHYQADEVYSPVCSYNTLRIMLSIAVQRGWRLYQADVVGAYLLSELPRPQYMTMPPGFEMYDEQGQPYVCKLLKGLYGTKSGGYHWHRTIDEFLRSIGFTQATGDVCLYLLTDYDHGAPRDIGLMLCLYVDDISLAASSADAYEWFIKTLGARFPINSDETGNLEWLLSMAIKYDFDAGTLQLTQTLAIERLYAVLGLEQETRAAVTTPMLDRLPRVATREVSKDEFDYLSVLGSVLHINVLTRPDISFAVSNLTRHASCPGRVHVRALKHLVRYLYDTRTVGITYRRAGGDNEPALYEGGMHPNTTDDNHLQIFCDADYAMDYTRRSTSGMIVMLNAGPVIWSSTLQKSTAQSTAEAEIIAAAEAAKWAVHIALMLNEMGARGDEPVTIFEDNAACIAQGQQLRNRRAAKHYEVRLRFLQELIRDKTIQFIYCPTKDQLADCFTKPLDPANFLGHRHRMLGV